MHDEHWEALLIQLSEDLMRYILHLIGRDADAEWAQEPRPPIDRDKVVALAAISG